MPVPTTTPDANVALLRRQAWRIPEDRIETFPSVRRPGTALARIFQYRRLDGLIQAFVYSDGFVSLGSSLSAPRATHNCASLEEAVQFVNTLYELGEL